LADATEAKKKVRMSADVITLMGQNFTGHLLNELSHTTSEENTVQEVSTSITEPLTNSSRVAPVKAMQKTDVHFKRAS